MKKLIIIGIIGSTVALLTSQITQGQGTIHLSNLGLGLTRFDGHLGEAGAGYF